MRGWIPWAHVAEALWVGVVGRSCSAGCAGRAATSPHGGSRGTDAYDVTLTGPARRVVVKIYPDGDGTASLEWSRLEFSQRLTALVPEPIAADLESVWFGRPAVVMSRLPGRPDADPERRRLVGCRPRPGADPVTRNGVGRGRGCAHAFPADRDVAPAGGRTRSPDRSRSPRRHGPSVFALLRARLDARGLPPGNVLWHRGRISGVVDWSAAGLGARWSELAYCRADVCLLLGPDVADRLADAYAAIVGHTSDDLAVYDLIWLFNIRHHAQVALGAYREQGHVPNRQLSLAHLDEQVRRVITRLDR